MLAHCTGENQLIKKECYLLSDKLKSMEICLRVNDTFIVHLQVDTQHSNNQNIFRYAFVELINTY